MTTKKLFVFAGLAVFLSTSLALSAEAQNCDGNFRADGNGFRNEDFHEKRMRKIARKRRQMARKRAQAAAAAAQFGTPFYAPNQIQAAPYYGVPNNFIPPTMGNANFAPPAFLDPNLNPALVSNPNYLDPYGNPNYIDPNMYNPNFNPVNPYGTGYLPAGNSILGNAAAGFLQSLLGN